MSEGDARDQRDLGVAVEEDLLEIVVELEVLDRLRLADQLGIPARFADRLALAHEGLDAGVVTQEVGVHVHDELVFERIGALLRHRRGRGLGLAHFEDRSVDLVHRHEARRHAGGGLEKFAAAQALMLAQLVAHGEEARFHFLLLLILRRRIELVAGYGLDRNRRRLQHFRRRQRGPFLFAQKAHESPPCTV